MNDYKAARYTDEECEALFASLCPQGFAGPDVLHTIAPEGWKASPLLAVLHPSLEQVYAETLRRHRNVQSLTRHHQERPPTPEPTRDDMAKAYRPTPVETVREVGELIGLCLWDIFSDNHEVSGLDGRLVDIGSFRGAGGFLADCLKRQGSGRYYDCLDFYMGTIWVAERADVTPVYEMIFRRLKAHGLDWTYTFPRIHMIDMRPLRDDQGILPQDNDDEHDRALGERQGALDAAHREALEEALDRPLPPTVQAYENVYGHSPAGWPPEASGADVVGGATRRSLKRRSCMSTHPVLQPVRFTMREYLACERAAAERHEYLDGLIYAMAGASENHGILCTNLTITLGNPLRGSSCRVFSKDTKVQVGPYRAHSRQGLYAYPDLLVVCGQRQYHDDARNVLLNPRVIIAVLSPSTSTFDRNDKFDRYRQWLSSLTDYLLVFQDAPKIDHYHRIAPQHWDLRILEGLAEVLRLPDLGCTIALADIYEDVAFPLPMD